MREVIVAHHVISLSSAGNEALLHVGPERASFQHPSPQFALSILP
jgi:hypothetical protein